VQKYGHFVTFWVIKKPNEYVKSWFNLARQCFAYLTCLALSRPQAQNVERCGSHFSGTSGIAVPKILHSLTSKRILTAEFIDGCVDNGQI
jgi:hypothetical protein